MNTQYLLSFEEKIIDARSKIYIRGSHYTTEIAANFFHDRSIFFWDTPNIHKHSIKCKVKKLSLEMMMKVTNTYKHEIVDTILNAHKEQLF